MQHRGLDVRTERQALDGEGESSPAGLEGDERGRVQVELELLVRGGDELAARLGAARGATLGVDALVTSAPPAELRVRVPLRSQSRVQDCRYVGME